MKASRLKTILEEAMQEYGDIDVVSGKRIRLFEFEEMHVVVGKADGGMRIVSGFELVLDESVYVWIDPHGY